MMFSSLVKRGVWKMRIPGGNRARGKRYARQAREGVCRAGGAFAMRRERFRRTFPA